MIKVWLRGKEFEEVFPNFYDPEIDKVKEAFVYFNVKDGMLKVDHVIVAKENGQLSEYGEGIGGTIWEMAEDDWVRLFKIITKK